MSLFSFFSLAISDRRQNLQSASEKTEARLVKLIFICFIALGALVELPYTLMKWLWPCIQRHLAILWFSNAETKSYCKQIGLFPQLYCLLAFAFSNSGCTLMGWEAGLLQPWIFHFYQLIVCGVICSGFHYSSKMKQGNQWKPWKFTDSCKLSTATTIVYSRIDLW